MAIEGSELVRDGAGSDDEGEQSKRQKFIDVMDHEKTSYAAIVGGQNTIGEDCNLESRCAFMNALFSDFIKQNKKDAKDCVEEDVVEVVMETKSMLATFDRFYDRGVILYFTSKLPMVSWIKQWLNSFIMPNCVEQVYAGPRGFYDVVFRSSEHRNALMAKVPLFFDKRLVHVMEWVPMVNYNDLLKQQCPIWVTVDCTHSFFWDLLPEFMAQIGKVLVAPHANSFNKCRFCMLWDTSCKLPEWLSINTSGCGRIRFKLQWETFAGHCFKCGQLGHFMADCSYHDEPLSGANIGEKGKSDVGKNIVLSTIDVAMDEGTSHGVERDSTSHIHGGVSVDDVVDTTLTEDGSKAQEWHQVQRKVKGKGIITQSEAPYTNVNVVSKGNMQIREGLKRNPWKKQARNQRLPNQLQFAHSGRVVHPQRNQRFYAHEEKHPPLMSGEGDVVHENPYAVLEQAVNSFMHTLARKEQALAKSV